MDSHYFRANVAALIVRGDQVLAFQRRDYVDNWQCAQGGLDVGEKIEPAMWREVQEETGLTQSDLQLKGEHPDWLSYEYSEKEGFGNCIGQTQKWFLLEFVGDEANIKIDEHEFSAWEWMTFAELQTKIPDFKRTVYIKLDEWLKEGK